MVRTWQRNSDTHATVIIRAAIIAVPIIVVTVTRIVIIIPVVMTVMTIMGMLVMPIPMMPTPTMTIMLAECKACAEHHQAYREEYCFHGYILS